MRTSPFDLYTSPNDNFADWVVPNLLNGWTNYGGAYRGAGWMFDELGWVVLRGLVAQAAVVNGNSVIFNLPNDMRATTKHEIFATVGSADNVYGIHRLDVHSTGNVVFVPRATGFAVAFISLSGIRFRPDNITVL